MKVMIAVDNSNSSRKAVEWVTRSNWGQDTVFRVLGVIDAPLMELGETADKEEAMQAVVDVDTNYLNTRLRGLHVDNALTCGKPASEIVLQAQLWQAELIIVGSLGQDESGAVLRGVGSDAILPGAPCPVVVVKEKKSRASEPTPLVSKNISAVG
jgi:nucleotide-binding universal stress UspA family protein